MATTPSAHAELRHAWQELRDALDTAERDMLAACGDGDAIDLAEGYRWLTEMLRTGLEMFVENSPASDVHFVPLIFPTRKGIGDNPDVLYDVAPLSHEHCYRISGRRGDAVYLGFAFYAMNAPGEMARWIFRNLSDADLRFDEHGCYEIEVSAAPTAADGVRLPARPALAMVRRYFIDREHADHGEVAIEYIGPRPRHVPLTAERATEGVRAAVRFFRSIAEAPQTIVRIFSGMTNQLFAPPPQASVSYPEEAPEADVKLYYPTPDASYPCGWFDLGDDQALLVTVRPPKVRYWSVHLMNRWFGSLDDSIPKRSVNNGNAVLEPDGSCRVVIAARDPGIPNWLWTAGHRNGFALLRWIVADQTPTPTCELVPLASLAGGAR